jgi:Na+/H+-dicarboxylate symporter
VSPRTTNVVIPLGATVNMDGTALYECVVVLFIAQVHGIDLGFTGQLVVVVMALLTSIGVAGVPSASLVAIVVIMQSVGLDVQSLGMILVFDRLLDMCRTTVNVLGDTCGAVVIARTEGETLKI